ncbi:MULTISPECIES: 50S ribosomal protein L10 [Desulfofundulus]|uniref:Large ribosomal subunit protein uL10 n=1 Tax=Desulfofundulus australicus DSM 11792 TaxID=1121425 RepID=A0A1M4YXU9_9FIRM|nr:MULTISPECIES: 50S ribosomal protein L10 [Desulfofundulus]MBE3585258.1 50S ribosomal protein L10 [Thermoanaerobacter sp.]MCS5695186.1 50S ribosomal protein L10 [Desulfofundulus thermocisternus]SHF10166.1 LSU ribosomal protein L10P [Desulfofundulus australicus DSM 11792]
MPTREEKQAILADLTEKFRKSKAAVLTDFRGLDVTSMTRVRRRLRESGSELKVAKNTLTRLAAKEAGLEGLEPYLEGPTAIAFGYEDPVAPAKVLSELAREFKQLEIKAGILEGKVIDVEAVRRLADLPSREVLLAKVAGGMKAPLYGFACSLQGLLRNLVYVLDAVRRQKAGEATT